MRIFDLLYVLSHFESNYVSYLPSSFKFLPLLTVIVQCNVLKLQCIHTATRCIFYFDPEARHLVHIANCVVILTKEHIKWEAYYNAHIVKLCSFFQKFKDMLSQAAQNI